MTLKGFKILAPSFIMATLKNDLSIIWLPKRDNASTKGTISEETERKEASLGSFINILQL